MLLQDHPCLLPGGVDSGLIRDEPHPLASQEIEIISLKHIDAEFHRVRGGDREGESKDQC